SPTASSATSTLSLHDALPICGARAPLRQVPRRGRAPRRAPAQGGRRPPQERALHDRARRRAVTEFDLPSYLAERRAAVDRALDGALPVEDVAPVTVHRAMRYSVLAGGKRLRPILVIAGAEA